MVNVDSTVRMNLPVIHRLKRAQVLALEQTAEAVHTELIRSRTMPWKTGALQGEGTFVDTAGASSGRVVIGSSTPYARRLYFHPEYNFSKSENPGAGGEWFKPFLPGGSKAKFAVNAFGRLYRRIAGT